MPTQPDVSRSLARVEKMLALRKMKIKLGYTPTKKKPDTKTKLRLTLERIIESITTSDTTKEQRLELLQKFHQHLLWFEERGLN